MVSDKSTSEVWVLTNLLCMHVDGDDLHEVLTTLRCIVESNHESLAHKIKNEEALSLDADLSLGIQILLGHCREKKIKNELTLAYLLQLGCYEKLKLHSEAPLDEGWFLKHYERLHAQYLHLVSTEPVEMSQAMQWISYFSDQFERICQPEGKGIHLFLMGASLVVTGYTFFLGQEDIDPKKLNRLIYLVSSLSLAGLMCREANNTYHFFRPQRDNNPQLIRPPSTPVAKME
ncbi:MAG: hypothetical protein WC785_04100 [Tatlockia sp.]|jgi:hypothetical protein